MKHLPLILLFLGLCSPASTVSAQLLYSTPGSPLVETFTLANPVSDGPITWTDNETFRGWYAAFYDGKRDLYETPLELFVSTGQGRPGSTLHLYRSIQNPSDGALGSRAADDRSPGIGAGGTFYGVYVVNATSVTLGTLSLSYRVEQYSVANTPDRQTTLSVSYRLGGEGLGEGKWTPVSGSNYTTPRPDVALPSILGELNGNQPENTVIFDALRVERLALAPGRGIWIRWFDVNNRFADHGIGIDDVSITLSP